jgi:hypothetical protein
MVAKFVKFIQFLNAANPKGSGTLSHKVGAVPAIEFAVVPIL